jgi:FtsP/CotA-like multicopper oxidase with cupredoxin domain
MPGQGAYPHGTEQHTGKSAAEPSAASRDADTNVDVTIDADAPAQVIRITRGAHVHLTVRGAGANEMHLHGYGIEVMGEADQPALIVFDASHTGRFALEMHVEDDLLGKGEKAVLYIEVREQ